MTRKKRVEPKWKSAVTPEVLGSTILNLLEVYESVTARASDDGVTLELGGDRC